MKQGGRKQVKSSQCAAALGRSGFTIVEVLIVLAITAALFVSAILLIGGKQDKTLFITSINDLQQQMQQIINETSSGYYPNHSNFSCSYNALLGPQISAVSPNAQGTNGDCLFLGNVIYFGTGNPNPVLQNFTVLPIAGNRVNPSGTMAGARPVAIAAGNTTNRNAPNTFTTYTMKGSLQLAWANNTAWGTKPFAVGVLSTYDNPTGESGSTQFTLYKFVSPFGTPSTMNDVVQSIDNAPPVASSTDVQFCIASGTTNQSGLFTISKDLHVDLAIKTGNTVCT